MVGIDSNLVIFMRPGREQNDSQALQEAEIPRVKNVARQFIAAGIAFDLILAAPHPAASETAQIVAASYKHAGREITVRPEVDARSQGHIPLALGRLHEEQSVLVVAPRSAIQRAAGHLIGNYYITPDYAGAVAIMTISRDWQECLPPKEWVDPQEDWHRISRWLRFNPKLQH